jgi:alpha-tubulin suppressor-like RCC1 family protein
VQIAAGKHNGYALDGSGNIYAWGANDYSQIDTNRSSRRNCCIHRAVAEFKSSELQHLENSFCWKFCLRT